MRTAVIGTGLVGSGWAIVFARAGHSVSMFDSESGQAARAVERIAENLRDLEEFGLVQRSEELLSRLTVCDSLDAALDEALYVQESGPEDRETKRAIYGALDSLSARECVLASSSSGIPISQVAESLAGRERCIVAHPVNPPYLVPVVEVVPAPWTSESIVLNTIRIMQDVGQVPVRLNSEIDGFLLNRLQGALLNEAFRLVEDGIASPDDIDKTVRDGLGLRWSFMGPFETIDLNAPGGIADYALKLGPMYYSLANQRGSPRLWTADLVEAIEANRRQMLEAGRLGERMRWRDRRLMALALHKQNQEKAGS